MFRMKVWNSRGFAERNKLFMEEWLTDFRSRLLKKCRGLMEKEYIVNVKTKDGEIIVFYNDKVDGQLKKMIVVTQEMYDELLKLIGRSETFDPSKDGLSSLPKITISLENEQAETNLTTVPAI